MIKDLYDLVILGKDQHGHATLLINYTGSHPNIQSNKYIYCYHLLLGQGPIFTVSNFWESQDVQNLSGQLLVANSGPVPSGSSGSGTGMWWSTNTSWESKEQGQKSILTQALLVPSALQKPWFPALGHASLHIAAHQHQMFTTVSSFLYTAAASRPCHSVVWATGWGKCRNQGEQWAEDGGQSCWYGQLWDPCQPFTGAAPKKNSFPSPLSRFSHQSGSLSQNPWNKILFSSDRVLPDLQRATAALSTGYTLSGWILIEGLFFTGQISPCTRRTLPWLTEYITAELDVQWWKGLFTSDTNYPTKWKSEQRLWICQEDGMKGMVLRSSFQCWGCSSTVLYS